MTSYYLHGLSEGGIYVNFKDYIYSLNRTNFINYKEMDLIILSNNKRVLSLPSNYVINFIYPTIKPIEIKKN